MKQIKLLALTLTTMLALTASIIASAQAATVPNVLPEGTPTRPLKANTSSGVSKFGNGVLSVTSRKSKGTQESEQTKLGHFDVLFEESEAPATGEPCTGLDDSTTGSILVLGTYHIRDHSGSPLTVAIFLIKPVHFWCAGTLAVLALVTGCAAGALTPESGLTKTLTVTLKVARGDNEVVTVLNEENSANELCQLLATENGGATKLSSEETTQTLKEWTSGGTATEVLVMPL